MAKSRGGHAALIGPIALAALLAVACDRPSTTEDSFTVRVAGRIAYVHNRAPKYRAPQASLEFLGTIGALEGAREGEFLYDPVDAARLPNGDILVLEGKGCAVKRFDAGYRFVSSFGRRGQGPGELVDPYLLRLDPSRAAVYVADGRISRFSPEGRFESRIQPERGLEFGSIDVLHRTSGLAVLSGGRVVAPASPTRWAGAAVEGAALSLYDENGFVIGSLGAVRRFDDPALTLNANIVSFCRGDGDRVYAAYDFQNRIDGYSADGRLHFSADRALPYPVETTMRMLLFKSGADERKFPWPSVTSVARGIWVDRNGLLWVLRFLRQPDKTGTFDGESDLSKCYVFEVFDTEGVLLFEVPFPNVRFDNIALYDDRLYFIDTSGDSCVREYRIVPSR